LKRLGKKHKTSLIFFNKVDIAFVMSTFLF